MILTVYYWYFEQRPPSSGSAEELRVRFKLVFKIFLAFFLTSLAVIVLMAGIMRHAGMRNFQAFVNRAEMERLAEVGSRLTEAYRERGGWGFIEEDPGALPLILRPGPQGTGPHGPMGSRMGRGRRSNVPEGCPPFPNTQGPRFEGRVTLFDERRQPLAGSAASMAGHTVKPITVDGKTVGWLGLRQRGDLSSPLEAGFLRQQSQTFLVTGLLALALSALVSFLLSRHLLKPVDALTRGADALACRKFDTRIQVNTRDELGQLADDFNRMAQTLERSERLRRQWISDISHELRTPLAILRAEVEAVQDGVMDGATTMDSVRAEIIRLGSIVDDLHELSLADSGSLPVDRDPVDALATLREALATFAPRFSQAGIAIGEAMTGAGLIVMGDRGRLFQVYSNILENSLRYTETGGVLKARAYPADALAHIHFEDSNPGVPDEALEKIFDRLYRVDGSRSRRHGGAGLGLAICKSLAEAMGGEIRAYHSPLGGLGIEIVLPLAGKV